jgi:hypothetical protein
MRNSPVNKQCIEIQSFIFPFLFLLFISVSSKAQANSSDTNRFETSIIYALQCPLSVNTPLDLVLQQDTRYRSRISIGIKYYPCKRWFAEYILSFSQQGGGYIKQKTNANYITGSFLSGFSSLHSRRLIFNVYCGIETNLLANARFINTLTKDDENVSGYFSRLTLSFSLGMGVKTRITGNYYLGCNTFVSFSPYKISNEPVVKVSQVIFPAFQMSLSKFIR